MALGLLVFTGWKAGRINTVPKINNLLLNLHVMIRSVDPKTQSLMVV